MMVIISLMYWLHHGLVCTGSIYYYNLYIGIYRKKTLIHPRTIPMCCYLCRNEEMKSTIERLQEDDNFKATYRSEKNHLQLLDEKIKQLQDIEETLMQQRKTINEKDTIIKSIKMEMQQLCIKKEHTLSSMKNKSKIVDLTVHVEQSKKDDVDSDEEYGKGKTYTEKTNTGIKKAEAIESKESVEQCNKDESLNDKLEKTF